MSTDVSDELVIKLEDCVGKISSLKSYFEEISSTTSAGQGDEIVDFMVTKQQLLLSYCSNLMYYITRKLKGQSVSDHPIMQELLALRLTMEKMKPLDSKLKHQIDRLMKLSSMDASDQVINSLRPNVANLLSKNGSKILGKKELADNDSDDDSEEDNGDSGSDNRGDSDDNTDTAAEDQLYRAPRMEAVPYIDAEYKANKEAEKLRQKRKKIKNSEIYAALREEFSSAPEQTSSTGIDGFTALEKKLKSDAKEKQDFEEERFIRMTTTRKEKKARKRSEREVNHLNLMRGFGNVEDFDDVIEAVGGSTNLATTGSDNDDEKGSGTKRKALKKRASAAATGASALTNTANRMKKKKKHS
jgi:hypothetical protein